MFPDIFYYTGGGGIWITCVSLLLSNPSPENWQKVRFWGHDYHFNTFTLFKWSNLSGEESNHSNYGLIKVWILNGQKEVGLQMVLILNGIWNPKPPSFEIQTNGHHLSKTIEIWTETFGFWMVRTNLARTFEKRTIWNPTFKKPGFQMFPYIEWSNFRSTPWFHYSDPQQHELGFLVTLSV